ncbi:Motile sperm domain-containing protein 1 [Argiope bruennichi]|uniref:Motile sperm domain-containing protein 1 n=1 Tax=Argiope bruennichi TaxID=94029 RepID=A0A8T0FQC0_ARGBR|nr:Motile sperm domain-containing protein 1 [Argiope bruennichi]
MHDPNLLDKLPVFTTPHQQITFYADDPSSHQQLLSIINPYDFFVKFKILVSPDCSKYSVSDAHGTIKPHHTATVTLHHLAVNSSNIGVTEKIRVFLYSTVDRTKVSGKRDLSVVLLDSAPKESQRSNLITLCVIPIILGILVFSMTTGERSNNKALYIIAIILGILVLAMPKEGDVNEYFPNILPRPTSEMKQMACFLLGILCTLLFQS